VPVEAVPVETVISIRPCFDFLFGRNVCRKQVIVGARGIGKITQITYAAVQKLLSAPRPNCYALALSYIIQQAKDTFGPALETIMHSLPKDRVAYNKSEHTYYFHKNAHDVRKFILLSYENLEFKRGYHPYVILLDEARRLPSTFFSDLYPALLDDGYIYIFGTAQGKSKFKELYDMAETLTGWQTHSLKASDAPEVFAPSFLAERKATMSPDEYSQEYENDWTANVIAESVYNYALRTKTIAHGMIKDEFVCDPSVPVWTAWDIGGDGTAIGFFQIHGPQVTFIDYYENSKIFDMGFYANEILSKQYNYAGHILPFDAFANNVRGPTISTFLSGMGLKCFEAPKLSEEAGIADAIAMLGNCRFNKTKCEALLDHLHQFSYSKDKYGAKTKHTIHDRHSHAADMFRYVAVSRHIWQTKPQTLKIITPKAYNPFEKYR
jgi:hypothetical protein